MENNSEAQVLPQHQAISDVDVWKKCIEDGALQECYGMDKACETVERRYNKVSWSPDYTQSLTLIRLS